MPHAQASNNPLLYLTNQKGFTSCTSIHHSPVQPAVTQPMNACQYLPDIAPGSNLAPKQTSERNSKSYIGYTQCTHILPLIISWVHDVTDYDAVSQSHIRITDNERALVAVHLLLSICK